jgi:hypothetical protein
MDTSKLFTLGFRDITLGFLMALIGGAIVVIYQFLIDGGILSVNWMNVLDAGLVSGVGYLIKNFFSDNTGNFGGVKLGK